jgi:2-hydroxymuconate-semialdehyde hydrolase
MTNQTLTEVTEEKFVHDGFTTSLRRSGSAELPAMLLIHGSGPGAAGWSNWQYLMPELGGQFHCIAMDLSGYGNSPAPEAMPATTAEWLEIWVAQIVSLVRKLGLGRVHLVGNSLGGALALHCALRAPDLFDRVALMGSAGVPCRLTRELDRIWGFYDNPTEEMMRLVMQWFAYDPEFLGERLGEIATARFKAAMQPEIRAAFASMFPAPREKALEALEVPDASLRMIRHPVLLIHGVEDAIVPLETSLTLIQRLGGPVQAHFYNRSSHWTQVEHKDSFNHVIAEFFSGRL